MGRKSNSPYKESSPRISDSALRCSTIKQQRILGRAGRAITAFKCNTCLRYSRSVRMHYRRRTNHSAENIRSVTNKWFMSPGIKRRVRRGRENRVNEVRSFKSECKGNRSAALQRIRRCGWCKRSMHGEPLSNIPVE